ncbi:C2H2 finger domain protein [Lentithecium fluviatile CBS 122367]|uniref:C2H2 finger domain protein n=1 Tax=Lentithecium fluviatile CBS 122367 TaxID=1168545 RepID=A0A6G1J5L5_9PLEO|nr:C2H2 finger domain protein [Lentithecium fluviatile CBS 122367]
MRRRSPVDSSSDESEYTGSGVDDGLESDTDLTDVDTCTDEDDEQCEGAEGEAWLSPDEDHPPEHYLQQLETFDEREYTKEDYKDSSTRLLDRMEDQWNQCWTFLEQDHLHDYATVSVGTLYTFFDWLLEHRRGKGGRRRRGTKYASSLGTYWKVFRLVYERATGVRLDGKMNRSMHKVLRKLAKKHSLKKVGRDKACMYVEDQTLVLQTNLVTTEKRYPHGRCRIQAQFYLQIGGFTVNRPGAILGLCYRHIRVTLLRDPEGGPHRVLLEFTFEFTKEFLGIKDMNTFPLPEIIYDESLIFSPHVLLLGMLFHDRAFAAYNLTSPEELSKLHIPPGRNELPLRLSRELDNIPVLRKAVKTPTGWIISPNEPLPYSTLLPWIRALGQITGFEQVTRPYSLRYAGGKAFNENGNVSEAMQNLMMGHASIGTFLKHYLSRRVRVDTQAVVRGIQPQDALMRAACTMSRSIDHRRPRRLTPEQSASVNDHPTVRSLLDRRERLKRALKNATKHPKYQELNRRINREKQRQRHALLQKVKEHWEYEQPVRDVEQQLTSTEIKDDHKVGYSTLLPAQKELVDAILARPGLTLEEEIRRRNTAISAVMRYCGIEEGGMHLSRPKRSSGRITPPGKSEESTQLDLDEKALEAAKVAVYKETRPRICFVCLGNENLPTELRTYSFYTSVDLSKHFKRKHLQHIKEGDELRCNLCQVCLDSKMHLRRHALDVHGTVS